jgi:hypothetical protein
MIQRAAMIQLHISIAEFHVSKHLEAPLGLSSKLGQLWRQIKTKQTVSTNIYQHLTTLYIQTSEREKLKTAQHQNPFYINEFNLCSRFFLRHTKVE